MHEKKSINFLSYILVCFLLLSCSTALDGVYTWDSFIKERSYDGDTFFAEAKAPNGIISYGSSNDSQGAANNMASRHCSENSGKICKITRTITLSKKQDIESLSVEDILDSFTLNINLSAALSLPKSIVVLPLVDKVWES